MARYVLSSCERAHAGGRRLRYMITLIALCLLLGGCAAAPKAETPSYRQISMREAIELMEKEDNYILLDVRRPDEFADRHIPGAINIPNETIGDAEIPALPDKAQRILVYCRSGNRSKQASEKLARLGYSNIIEFGGINDWPGETVSGANG